MAKVDPQVIMDERVIRIEVPCYPRHTEKVLRYNKLQEQAADSRSAPSIHNTTENLKAVSPMGQFILNSFKEGQNHKGCLTVWCLYSEQNWATLKFA